MDLTASHSYLASSTKIPMEISQEEFERQLIDLLLQGDHSVLSILRQQYAAASVVLREFTGVGFFTTFSVPDDLPRVTPPNLTGGDVCYQLADPENGGGCVLFVRDGALHLLEAYTFEEPWPDRLNIIGIVSSLPVIPTEG